MSSTATLSQQSASSSPTDLVHFHKQSSKINDQLIGHIIFGTLKSSQVTLLGTGTNTALQTLFAGIASSFIGKSKPCKAELDHFDVCIGVCANDNPLEKVRKAFKLVMGSAGFVEYSKKIQQNVSEKTLSLSLDQPNLLELWGQERIKTASTLKFSRITLWKTLADKIGVPIDENSLRNTSGVDVEKPFQKWIQENQGALEKIQSLSLAYKNLRYLPPEIGFLSNLIELDLSYNRLKTLSESIVKLSNLIELKLCANNLMTLPESIVKLSNLIELKLCGNNLIILPKFIGKLSNLRKLKLFGNNLTILPESIVKLSNLIELDLSCNKLKTLPESIGKLSNLRNLNLLNNKLTILPPSFAKLSLEILCTNFTRTPTLASTSSKTVDTSTETSMTESSEDLSQTSTTTILNTTTAPTLASTSSKTVDTSTETSMTESSTEQTFHYWGKIFLFFALAIASELVNQSTEQ